MDREYLSKVLSTMDLLERMTSLKWSFLSGSFYATSQDEKGSIELKLNGDSILWSIHFLEARLSGSESSITRALAAAAAALGDRRRAYASLEAELKNIEPDEHQLPARVVEADEEQIDQIPDELPARVESGGGGASIEADEEQIDQLPAPVVEAPSFSIPLFIQPNDPIGERQNISINAKRLILENPHCGSCGTRYHGPFLSYDAWVYDAKIDGTFYRYRVTARFICRQCGKETSSNYFASTPTP